MALPEVTLPRSGDVIQIARELKDKIDRGELTLTEIEDARDQMTRVNQVDRNVDPPMMRDFKQLAAHLKGATEIVSMLNAKVYDLTQTEVLFDFQALPAAQKQTLQTKLISHLVEIQRIAASLTPTRSPGHATP